MCGLSCPQETRRAEVCRLRRRYIPLSRRMRPRSLSEGRSTPCHLRRSRGGTRDATQRLLSPSLSLNWLRRKHRTARHSPWTGLLRFSPGRAAMSSPRRRHRYLPKRRCSSLLRKSLARSRKTRSRRPPRSSHPRSPSLPRPRPCPFRPPKLRRPSPRKRNNLPRKHRKPVSLRKRPPPPHLRPHPQCWTTSHPRAPRPPCPRLSRGERLRVRVRHL